MLTKPFTPEEKAAIRQYIYDGVPATIPSNPDEARRQWEFGEMVILFLEEIYIPRLQGHLRDLAHVATGADRFDSHTRQVQAEWEEELRRRTNGTDDYSLSVKANQAEAAEARAREAERAAREKARQDAEWERVVKLNARLNA